MALKNMEQGGAVAPHGALRAPIRLLDHLEAAGVGGGRRRVGEKQERRRALSAMTPRPLYHEVVGRSSDVRSWFCCSAALARSGKLRRSGAAQAAQAPSGRRSGSMALQAAQTRWSVRSRANRNAVADHAQNSIAFATVIGVGRASANPERMPANANSTNASVDAGRARRVRRSSGMPRAIGADRDNG
ncbi:MAG TPA: hypothetical protein VM327_07610 [Candidatus Thermoplasmatota archaeon]|nr:hypothetical protein [Candidatus Thermoplasmatota archaeon]